MPEAATHEAHFESLERQKMAARLGTWVFLASELLLFAGLLALYASGRASHPEAFRYGVAHAMVWAGTVNTFVLLTSSFCIARAVHALRADRRRLAGALTGLTLVLAVAFLALKGYEYHHHLAHGQVPGGRSAYFVEHAELTGLPAFFTLYWITTGTHAVHVTVGAAVLAFFGLSIVRGRLRAPRAHRLEMAALYWHLVDAIWIFLWPMYYLMK
ncbi:MAG TPA: cytochrome c oxidase subunit 3 [Sandaracinaceae bacterium LLY-WYZ-13_1]|nr:cytochrome c oxidase subunit 3 [Sandaracinaceae bacterium LLY-WYZ-13_1]